MKRSIYILVLVSILVALVFSACTPKSTSAPAASPGKAPAAKPEAGGAEWDKVVEAAKKEGKLTAYNFFYSGEAGASFMKAFKDKYGITIEGVQGSAAVNVEKIKSENAAGKDAADIFETTVTGVWSLKAAGLLAPVGDLPVLKNKSGWVTEPVADPEKMVLLYGIGYTTPWINTNLVKPGDEPKSYKDFLDPKWKGKIVISDPRLTPMLARLYVTLRRNGTMDTNFFTALAKQDIKWASSVTEAASILARGEAYANVPSTDMFEGPLLLKGAPLKPIDVAEGAVILPAPGIGVLKNAPHPNAARVFVNWLLSEEGQKAYHGPRGGTPIVKVLPSFLPQAARVEPKKSFLSTPADDSEASRVVREKEIAKLIGLEK